jgi:Bacteriophage tail sheath protein
MVSYRTPGVYLEPVFLKPAARLETGVPGFVGFVNGPFHTPLPLHRKDEFATRFTPAAGSFLADSVAGFFGNGGVRCYVVGADPDPSKDRATALIDALEALGPLVDLDLVAAPDAMVLADGDATALVQRRLLEHCARHGDRLAILDALPGATTTRVLAQRSALTIGQTEPVNAALYHPWVKVASPAGGLRSVPPSGHVAGIYSRTDARVGVFKAPANEPVIGALDLDPFVDADAQDRLNPEGVNCLRLLPGRAIRVFGARTLSRQDEWRYVSVRRLLLTLRRWLDRNMTFAMFEPNGPRLWIRIRRELTIYLTQLWEDGALAGDTPDEAFFVKCDVETNPPESRESGAVVTDIGLAPSAPAEFIVVRIVQRETTLA